MHIKICGITRLEDAISAVESGATALGFNLADSPRRISEAMLVTISSSIPDEILRVGVFVNPRRRDVEEVLSKVKLDYLQFHGQESGTYCQSFDCKYIKAIAVSGAFKMSDVEAEHPKACAFLLDTFDTKVAGGSGRQFNWDFWPQDASKPLILAGGLNADNVVQGIQNLKPQGVDVCGGVEVLSSEQGATLKGIKDPGRIRKFIIQVRSCS